jgi:hypothetical protein
LIVLVCGGLGAVVAGRTPRPAEFLAVAQFVPAGMPVASSDVETVSMTPAPGLAAIPLREAGQVVGRRATEPLAPGSLLVPSDLSPHRGLPAGRALVGTSLAVNQLPAELAGGQVVLVVLSGTGGSGASSEANSPLTAGAPDRPAGSVLTQAVVVSVSTPSDSSGPAGAEATTFVVSLEVPEVAAAAVAAASAAGDVSLAVLGGSN